MRLICFMFVLKEIKVIRSLLIVFEFMRFFIFICSGKNFVYIVFGKNIVNFLVLVGKMIIKVVL